MLLSGALAGLVGLPELLGDDYRYGFAFTSGLGFSGIAVALLGRNTPVGIAFASLLFAFLDRAGPSLEAGIPSSVSRSSRAPSCCRSSSSTRSPAGSPAAAPSRPTGQGGPPGPETPPAGPTGPAGSRIDERQGAGA